MCFLGTGVSCDHSLCCVWLFVIFFFFFLVLYFYYFIYKGITLLLYVSVEFKLVRPKSLVLRALALENANAISKRNLAF